MLPPGFSPRRVLPRGSQNADIAIVGEAPGVDEDFQGRTFVGQSGQELERMLGEAGILVHSSYFTNVIKHRPPDNDIEAAFFGTKKEAKLNSAIELNGCYPRPFVFPELGTLKAELESVQPKTVLALGNAALWALCGERLGGGSLPAGISTYRGSVLPCTLVPGLKVIPTLHPAAILRAWGDRYKVIRDFKRAKHESQFPAIRDPGYRFIIRPSFSQAIQTLKSLAAGELGTLVANDIETRSHQISCTGFAWSATEAICIPFFRADGSPYWSTDEEEVAVVEAVREVLQSPAIELVGQNYAYDAQYNYKRMLVMPRRMQMHDTMLAQHVLYPGEDKDLSFISSLLCEHHRYWKQDSKVWDPKLTSEEAHWTYNCTDCVKTWEILPKQQALIARRKLDEQYAFMMRLWPKAVRMMLRGIKSNKELIPKLIVELGDAIKEREEFIHFITDGELNIASPKSMKWFFLEALGFKPKKHKKTKQISLGKEVLEEYKQECKVITPVVNAIVECKSLRTFKKNFATMPIDGDSRIRCYYNIAGTETFRWSSSESAFDTGTNLQNVPKGDRSKTMKMPNMRRMMVPDQGYLMFDIDLAGADAQVVAAEADDAYLREAFRRGFKIHAVNAKDIFGGNAGADGKREPYYTYAKQGVHLTNYRGRPNTLARTLGITRHEADQFQKKWLGLHPGIPKWWVRIDNEMAQRKTVTNKFGFQRQFFDRVENCIGEYTAWGPQSTVAIVTNKGLIALDETYYHAVILLQTHDSVTGQIPFNDHTNHLREVHKRLSIPVPYSDPLYIRFGLAVSDKSWGDLETIAWPE